MNTLLVTAAIFVFTYALISVGSVPKLKLSRGMSAALGGALMVLFGIVPLSGVLGLIDLDVIFLLLGMMMLAAGLEFSGFFRIVSDFLTGRADSRVRLLAYVMVICAVLSALVLNDAVVLIFTPIVIRCCRNTGSNPVPYLIGVMFSANIGSLATSVGNPQNAYIASHAGIPFIDFAVRTIPVSLVCLPIAFLVIYAIFRRHLTSGCVTLREEPEETDRIRLWAVVTVTAGAVAGFTVSDAIGIGTHAVAMAAGILALVIVVSGSPRNIVRVVKKIDWMILVFFIGLFVLMGAVVASGLLDEMASVFPGFGPGETPSVLSVTAFSAILSNLVSNVPAVMLIGNLIPAENTALWIALAASSTLAGNATIIASAANVIVSERSEADGITFSFWRFAAIGVPVTIITLLVSIGVLMLML